MDTGYKRSLRNFLINPVYQLKYIFWVGASGFALVILNAGVFYYYIRENYAILVELSPMTEETKAQLYSELYSIMIKLGAGSILFLVLVALFGVVLSHRTAGALYHFNKIFNAIKSGQTSARIKLRPSDDFQEVAREFNEMMDALTEAKTGK